MHEISTVVSLILAGILAVAGVAHFFGPRLLLTAYPTRDFARTRRRFTGVLRILAALFLAVPATRIWGGELAAIIAFAAVVVQLQNARYMWAVPGMAVMIALPIAMVSAAPF